MSEAQDEELDRLSAEFRTQSSALLKTLGVGDRFEPANVELTCRAASALRHVLEEIETLLRARRK